MVPSVLYRTGSSPVCTRGCQLCLSGFISKCGSHTYCSISRWCVESRYTRSTSSALLCDSALRGQLQTQLTLEIHLLEHLVVSNVTRNHGADLLRLQKLSKSDTRHTGVIADDCEVCKIASVA